MSYQALYRAFRPQTFADLVGQPHVKQTLSNAMSRDQVAHAYLFCGPRGTGKTSAAKILAKAVNCLNRNGIDPCNVCPACRSIQSGSDVDVEEIDAASNRGVDEIRQLREKVQYAPASLHRKVYIVDEVHMLTAEAFNALLKTLEEPPGHTMFVLATTEPHKIPATIVSRCQRFDFRRIGTETIMERLRYVCTKESWEYDEEALWQIADAADGGLRDALGLLEQTSAYGQGTISTEHAAHVVGGVQPSAILGLIHAVAKREFGVVLDTLMEWYMGGKDAARILQEILQGFRDVLVAKLSTNRQNLPTVRAQKALEVAEVCREEWLFSGIKTLGDAYAQLRFVDQPRLALETCLLRIGHQEQLPSIITKPSNPSIASPDGTSAESAGNEAEIVDRPEGHPANEAKPVLTKKTSAARKTEVLQDLQNRADESALAAVQESWQEILGRVRSLRIQTHAWLMNGQPILATSDALVLAFSSRIHRDAVMKPDERSAVEQGLVSVLERPLKILAILQSDWEKFHADKAPQVSKEPVDFVQRAVDMFGSERVEVLDKE